MGNSAIENVFIIIIINIIIIMVHRDEPECHMCCLCLQPDLSSLKLEADCMWRQFMSAMVPEITNLVRFCKKLPGRLCVV